MTVSRFIKRCYVLDRLKLLFAPGASSTLTTVKYKGASVTVGSFRTCVRLNQTLLLPIIHPISVRRKEYVGWRALLDLLDEVVAGGV
jgi:hypothetical protein